MVEGSAEVVDREAEVLAELEPGKTELLEQGGCEDSMTLKTKGKKMRQQNGLTHRIMAKLLIQFTKTHSSSLDLSSLGPRNSLDDPHCRTESDVCVVFDSNADSVFSSLASSRSFLRIWPQVNLYIKKQYHISETS